MINADLSVPVIVRSAAMDWTPSPSPHVLRKRFFLRGPAEAGQVTSLVKYLPGAEFPSHGHPDGEEILVLDGVFSDQTGDWPAGSWLLNPEGFAHGPWSAEGCLLFVRLRQYPGRCQQTVTFGEPEWQRLTDRVLLASEQTMKRICVLAPDQSLQLAGTGGVEGFVLDGHLKLDVAPLEAFDWFRVPAGERITLESEGCALYLDEGSVSRLADTGR